MRLIHLLSTASDEPLSQKTARTCPYTDPELIEPWRTSRVRTIVKDELGTSLEVMAAFERVGRLQGTQVST